MNIKDEDDFVKNLNCEREVKSFFAVSKKFIKTQRNGGKFIRLTLQDKTGQINCMMFSNGRQNHEMEDLYDSIETGKVYEILGDVDEYKGRYNIKLKNDHLNRVEENEVQMSDFTASSQRDLKELEEELNETIDSIENEHYKNLLEAVFSDRYLYEKFIKAPAAEMYHHNYTGGLLEHTVEVLRICRTMCEIFPELDSSLLYTGAILHDLGKINAYDYNLMSRAISDDGIMLGHLFISCQIAQCKMDEVYMPLDLAKRLMHLILSHHGDRRDGWGSAVDPETPEAVALHYADNLDARVKGKLQEL